MEKTPNEYVRAAEHRAVGKLALFLFVLVLCGCVSPKESAPPGNGGLTWRKPPVEQPDRSWYPFPAGRQVVRSERTERELDAYERAFSPETYWERKRSESR